MEVTYFNTQIMKILNTKWFTLFELLVILWIISIMAAFVIIPYSQISNQSKLKSKAYEVTQIINKAEALNLSWYQIIDKTDNKEKSADIYIEFNKSSNEISLKWMPYSLTFPPADLTNTLLVEGLDLEKTTLTNLSDNFYILFKAPNADIEYYLWSTKIINLANIPEPKLKIWELPEYDLNIR